MKILLAALSFSLLYFVTSCGGKKDEGVKTCAPPPSAFLVDHNIERDINGDAEKIFINSPDLDPNKKLRLYTFPWAPHAGVPHSGHPGDDAKANMFAHFVHDDNQANLVELAGDSNGTCDPGETCGLPLSLIMSQRPHLISPSDNFQIRSVVLDRVYPAADNIYVGTANHWIIEGTVCQYHYSFGHIGWVAPDLRDKMVNLGLPDPNSYTGPLEVNLLNAPIYLSEGESIAIPHIIGDELSAHPTYYNKSVKAQIEIPTRDLSKNQTVPIYSWQSPALQQDLATIMQKEMRNPSSIYYDYSAFNVWEWLIKAEADLWSIPMASRDDYSGIMNNASAWYEKPPGSCSAADAHPNRLLCDDAITFWPIGKANSVYDPSLYDSPSVSFLALKSKAIVPTADPLSQHNYFNGEILSPTTDLGLKGTMTFKWRQKSYLTPITPLYQKATYALIPSQRVLKIHWGEESTNRAYVEGLSNPADPTSLSCNGAAVVCYDHEWRADGVRRPGY